MLARLRRRLTGFAALLTGSVVIIVMVVSFLICARLYTNQRQTMFEAAVSDLFNQWNYHTSVDLSYLQQTARNNGLFLYFEENGTPLMVSKIQNPKVDVNELLGLLKSEQFDPKAVPLFDLDEVVTLKNIKMQNEPIRVMAHKIQIRNGWRLLVAWQPLVPEYKTLSWVALGFGIVACMGIGTISVLCWIVAGRAIQPIHAAMQEQKEFIRAAGHELRTPLGVFRAGLAVLPEEGSASARRHMKLLDTEAIRMSNLIDNLLILSGGGSLKTSPKQKIEPDTLLLDFAEAWEPAVRRAGLQLSCSLPEEMLPTIISSKEELCQILSAFLDNALSYAPTGSKIELSCGMSKHKVYWAVSDHGPGIPDAQKEKIFKRFWRAEESRKDREHFGLGLSVAEELADRCGAKLFVKDTLGGGATFGIELPLINLKE